MLNASKELQPLVEQHTLRIDKLAHNLHNTNQWCIQAAQNWMAAHMRFQVMEQRIAHIEQSPPSVKEASLVDPKATCQSPPFSLALQQVPEVTTQIFLAPVLTESEKQTDHAQKDTRQVALVSRKPDAPFYKLSHMSIMPFTVDGFTVKTVTQAVTRIADTYYGSPKHPSPEIPMHLDVPDEVQSRYSFNLPQILTHVYAHKVNQDANTAAELKFTGLGVLVA
jgi:hypothetical protein